MRRGALVMLVVNAAVVSAVVTAVAVGVEWLPEQASEERELIDFVFWLTTWICVAIFAVVASVSIYAGVKFRVRPDDETDGPPIHGHTGLEILWTAVPFVLVTVISIASAVVLARNDRAGPNPLRVSVLAQQFTWLFTYPNGVTSGELRLPLDRSTELRLRARDVIHSFWVPQFGQKQDAVPGIETKIVVTPTKLGAFPLACAELCGLGHSVMRTRAVVMPAQEFDAWLQREQQRSAGSPGEAGAASFERNGCGGCHEFAPARSTGRTGPALDNLERRARAVGMEPEEFVRESIVEPDAKIAPGFPPRVMPKTYDALPDRELDALVQYLLEGEGARE